MLQSFTASLSRHHADIAEVKHFIDDQVHVENLGIIFTTEQFQQNNIASGAVDNCVGIVTLDYEGALMHIHTQDYNELTTAVVKAHQQLLITRSQHAECEEARRLKDKTIRALEADLAATTSERKSLKEITEKQQAEVKILKKLTAEQQATNSRQQGAITKQQGAIEKQSTELTALKKLTTVQQSTINEQQSSIKALQDELERLNFVNAEQQAENNAKLANYATLFNDMTKQQASFKNKEAAFRESVDELFR